MLALLNHAAPRHYLAATGAAIDLTLLHNFFAHLHYTWRDRREAEIFGRLVRFHASNGLVSMTGNLLLTRRLVGAAHLPVLAANGIAILVCSVINFWLGHAWAFATRVPVMQDRAPQEV